MFKISEVCFLVIAFETASACTFNVEDEQELVFSSSEDESSDFEGFDLDEMPLSYFARGKFEAYCTLRNAPDKVS